MLKKEKIKYLKEIVCYLNLKAVCDLYNSKYEENKIDYNNLRVVLKQQNEKRLSENKIDSFIEFIQKDFVSLLIPKCVVKNDIKNKKIESIIAKHSKELTKNIIEEL